MHGDDFYISDVFKMYGADVLSLTSKEQRRLCISEVLKIHGDNVLSMNFIA